MKTSSKIKTPKGSVTFPLIFIAAAACLIASIVMPMVMVNSAYKATQTNHRARPSAQPGIGISGECDN